MVDEYIRKADAVEALDGKIIVTGQKNADTVLQYMKDISNKIKSLKPADVAPVVRCKDCKSRRIDGYCTKFQNNISGIAVSWFMPEDDGFCSYGKRKGE